MQCRTALWRLIFLSFHDLACVRRAAVGSRDCQNSRHTSSEMTSGQVVRVIVSPEVRPSEGGVTRGAGHGLSVIGWTLDPLLPPPLLPGGGMNGRAWSDGLGSRLVGLVGDVGRTCRQPESHVIRLGSVTTPI